MDIYKKRILSVREMVTIPLAVSALVLLAVSFIVKDDAAGILRNIGLAFILSAIIFRLFKWDMGHKPTLEDMEEGQFEKKNNLPG